MKTNLAPAKSLGPSTSADSLLLSGKQVRMVRCPLQVRITQRPDMQHASDRQCLLPASAQAGAQPTGLTEPLGAQTRLTLCCTCLAAISSLNAFDALCTCGTLYYAKLVCVHVSTLHAGRKHSSPLIFAPCSHLH